MKKKKKKFWHNLHNAFCSKTACEPPRTTVWGTLCWSETKAELVYKKAAATEAVG
jgi:hypothetical protein